MSVSQCTEETTQQQWMPMFSLLLILIRSRIITFAFGPLCEIIEGNTCVITKAENFVILTFFIIHLIQIYMDVLAKSSQYCLTPPY